MKSTPLRRWYIPGTYQVLPYLIPDSRDRNRCGLCGLADHWSVKKPIDADLSLSSPDLKALRDTESMMCWGRRFHRSIIRSEKKCRLDSRRYLFLVILTVCPLVSVILLSVNMLSKLILDHPLYILNTNSNRSERFRLSSKDHKPSNCNLWAYANVFTPGNILVKRCWSRSSIPLSFLGDQADMQNSRCGRTRILVKNSHNITTFVEKRPCFKYFASFRISFLTLCGLF